MIHWAFFVVAGVIIYLAFPKRNTWPDGPSGWPFLGVLPEKNVHLHQQLQRLVPKYGDFFSFNMGSSKAIVLSSPRAVEDLIIKKGGKYSSRPTSSPTGSIVARGRLVQLPYGNEFRLQRKAVHSLLGLQNAATFMPYQEFESRQTLRILVQNPTTFFTEVHRYSASVTFSLLMGARFAGPSIIPMAVQSTMYKMFLAMRPGHYIADWIPILNYMPDALAPWRKHANRVFDELYDFWGIFSNAIVDRLAAGDPSTPDCFVKRFLESPDIVNFTEIDRRMLISDLLAAGSETTATTLQWFCKAALLYPAAIKTAQQEIDDVVGRDRLPGWEDRANLPYLRALTKELHRWASPAVLAFYHETSEQDEYRGKVVPAKTTVIYNTYGIHHDDNYYKEHDKFLPERFLDEKHSQYLPQYAHAPIHYGFGVGRRECPGKHVAESSLYIMLSRMLWSFNFEGPRPGNETVGLVPILGPAPFECNFVPRDEKTAAFLLQAAEVHDPNLRVEDAAKYESQVKVVLDKYSS